MSLQSEFRHLFPTRFRARGQEYFEQGRVSLVHVDAGPDGPLAFEIRGSGGETWEVWVEPHGDSIDLECDCPAAARYDNCKHMWAVLLELDAGMGGGVRGPDAAPPPGPAPAIEALSGRTDSGWQALLGAAGSWSTVDDGAAMPQEPRATGLLHVLDEEALRRGSLELWTWESLPEDDAAPDHPDISHADPPPLGEVVERQRLEPVTALDLLAALARNGKLWRGQGQGSIAPRPTRPLQIDTGPPWRLRVRLEGPGRGGNYQLAGEFWRPAPSPPTRALAAAAGGSPEPGDPAPAPTPQTLPISAPDSILLMGLLQQGDSLAAVRAREHWPWILRLRAPEGLEVTADELDSFRQQVAMAGERSPIELPEELKLQGRVIPPTPALHIQEKPWEGRRWPYELRLKLEYPGRTVEPFESDRSLGVDGNELLLRDLEAERAALDFLRAQEFKRSRHAHCLELREKELLPAIELFLQQGWRLYYNGEGVQPAPRPQLQVREDRKGGWFEIGGGVELDGEDVGVAQLVAAVLSREKVVRTEGGRLLLIDEALARSLSSLGQLAESKGEGLRMPRSQGALLDALLAQQEDAPRVPALAELRRAQEELRAPGEALQPRGMGGELRAYQQKGLHWMLQLDRLGLGGCLADDMGLGKTVQVIALLQALRIGRRRKRSERRPHLVVAPRSVVHNWAAELERFVPHLQVVEHTGPDRHEALDELAHADVILTTYGTLRRDAPELAAIELDYLVLDEAQAIKNPRSVSAKAARLLNARHRLALSGTPVENNLGELWALMDFLQPGLLGPQGRFRRWLKGQENGSAAQVLGRVAGPYMLRRRKDEVLDELPPRTEQLVSVDLPAPQRRFYEELRQHFQASVGQKLQRQSLQRTRMHVLEALLRLRQAACHPGLLSEEWEQGSAKLDSLIPMLEEIAGEGHKALVFSQFTRLLALVRERLEEAGLGYSYLDGRTRKRKERIDEFAGDPTRSAFLISLKAGGVGLNLTCANYVFLLDPWWNPAVEAQAIDRAHRIGQEQPVFSYRLVAQDTVEEKILALQERKQAMVEKLLEAGRGGMGGLSEEDVAFLLG